MKKVIGCIIIGILLNSGVYAQKYVAKDAQISFFSKTPAENISAVNKSSIAILSLAEKKVAAVIVMRNFVFPVPLMQEHFNENYVESAKFPKATFEGSFTGDVNIVTNGVYPIQINGYLTLHGVKKAIEFPAKITVNNGALSVEGNTKIALVDYKIAIPKVVFLKIAEKIDISFNINFPKL